MSGADGVRRYERLLSHAGIRVHRLDSYGGRTTSDVKVGTFLRAKGLEFKHVFMPQYLDFIREAQQRGDADADWLAIARNQVYVGMTRARDTLWLGTVEAS